MISLAEVIDPNQLLIQRRLKVPSYSLFKEQQKPGVKKPHFDIKVHPNFAGTRRLTWERLYSGVEAQNQPALAFDGQGNMHRGQRASLLQRQRVSNPGPGSDFSLWTDVSFYRADTMFTMCALGSEIIYFFFPNVAHPQLNQHRSTNHGSTWTTGAIGVAYTANTFNTNMKPIGSDFKPNGDILVACLNYSYANNTTGELYVIRRLGGAWQDAVLIASFTAAVFFTGIAVKYDGDWNLIYIIQQGGRFSLFRQIYGDGFRVASGSWTSPEELFSIPDNQGYSWHQPFLTTLPGDKRPSFLMSFCEKYTGTEAISRPYLSHGLKDHDFLETLFREPSPFNYTTEFGLALERRGDYAWAATPEGVWRAYIPSSPVDVSKDIISLNETIAPFGSKLTIELNNSKGTYNNPGTGALVALNRGSEVRPSLGLRHRVIASEAWQSEAVLGDHYWIESLEHRAAPNERTFVITCDNAWGLLRRWTPRHTLRWTTLSVIRILRIILARVGIPLDIISCSPAILGFIPDFTVSPGDNGLSAVQRLLEFVPDVLLFSRGKGYLITPSGDIPVYSYGRGGHPILESRYAVDSPEITRVQVLGRSGATDIVVDVFDWGEIALIGDRLDFEPDLNIATIPQARDRATAILREQAKDKARILTLPNFALDLFDPIEVTDLIAPISKARYRVNRTKLNYDARKSQYAHELTLTGV